jgi:hypothetical protein
MNASIQHGKSKASSVLSVTPRTPVVDQPYLLCFAFRYKKKNARVA